MKALVGRKVGMSQIIESNGTVVPVTLVCAGPCFVAGIKSVESDGYQSLLLGFERAKKPAKAQISQYAALKVSPKIVKEIRLDEQIDVKVGDEITVDIFSVGDRVDVQGISKGKGFAGTIKRHNFNTGPKTHGSASYRRPGSIGSMYPQKVMRGKKMAGQYGASKNTVKNQTISFIDQENNLIGINGQVPGPRKSLVLIRGVA